MRWETVKLNNLIDKPISGEWGDEEGDVNVLRSTNFTNDGTLNFTSVVGRNISAKKIEQKALKIGDTIIEKSGGSPNQPVGRVVYFEREDEVFLCNNFTSVLRPQKKVFPKFLFWSLFNNHLCGNTLRYQNKTTGIINLQLERYLKEIQIPLPPLPTQKHIAEILDRADALRKKDRQLLQYYDDLAQSLFIEMFGDPVRNEKGWEERMVEEVLLDIIAGTSYGGEEKELKEDELGVLKISAVTTGNFLPSEFKAIKTSQIIKAVISPKKGDLLFSRANTRELVGAACIVDSDYPRLFLPDKLWRLDLNLELCNSYYFKFLLSYKSFKAILTKTATGTSGSMLNISMQKLRSLKIPLPPINHQLTFATQIQNIEKQKAIVKKQMEASEQLFQALLQQAFNGGIN